MQATRVSSTGSQAADGSPSAHPQKGALEVRAVRNRAVHAGGDPISRLVHGNELLAQIERTYQTERIWRARQHTVRRVIASLKQPILEIGPPLGFSEGSALDAFVGYLALDALIGNQDRHHENWGVIVGADGDVRLAPTYDHASSLGRNEKDAVRRRKLTTRDAGDSVESYVARATSALYRSSGDSKALPTLESFRLAG